MIPTTSPPPPPVPHPHPNPPQTHLKILLLGPQKSGKTSLLSALLNQQFNPNQYTTIGADFKSKNVTMGGCQYRAVFWDTAGLGKYGSVMGVYLKEAVCVVVVVDVAGQNWKQQVDYWINIPHTIICPQTPIILCLNKSDLLKQPHPQIPLPLHLPLIPSLPSSIPNIPTFFTSAKQNININQLNSCIIQKTVEYYNRCKDVWNNKVGKVGGWRIRR